MDELISKRMAIDAAIEAVDDWDGETNIGRQKRIEKYINALPSAELMRKKGNWVWKNKKEFCPSDCWFPPTGFEDTWNKKEGSWIEKQLYCSECNYENWRHYRSNFCPDCGADMREVTE